MKVCSHRIRRIAIPFLLFAVLGAGNSFLLPALRTVSAKSDKPIVGQLIVSGAVSVNDKKAINGTSIYNNSRLSVACANGNRAIVNLGSLGRIELAPGSQMVLKFSEGLISGDLVMGKIVVNSPAGVKVAINTQEGVSAADGTEPSLLAVATQRGVRCVPVMTSQSNSVANLSSGALAAILLGAGGVAAIGAIAASDTEASNTRP